jgi:8-oxo-dGTP diphosphatase
LKPSVISATALRGNVKIEVHAIRYRNVMKPGVDYVGVGVGAIIVDGAGRLFAALRGSQAKNERGKWEFPGGSVEFGEKLTDALEREMFEEYGIRIEVRELLDVVDHILPVEGQHWVSPTFICRIVEGIPEIREPGKCSQINWFFPEEMPGDLSGASKQSLEHYKQYLRKNDPPAIRLA